MVIRQSLDASLEEGSRYTIGGEGMTRRILTAIEYVKEQERKYEVRCLKDGSHNYWRKHQITVRRWSTMVESLEHERGPWGELGNNEGCVSGCGVTRSILTLTGRYNKYNMHSILVKDPKGTNHADASVWNETLEEEEKAQKESGMLSLMRSSVEEDIDEEQEKAMNEELMANRHQGRILFSQECLMVVPMLAVRGKLELSTSTLSFTISPEFEAEFKQQIEKQAAYIANAKRFEGVNKFLMLTLPENKIWKLGELTHEEFRLYLFRQTAVELFFQDGSSSFFSFTSPSARGSFHDQLRRLSPANLTPFLGATAEERYAHDDSTRRWVNREISTFEYLMRLNRLAGRTYNDLSQYYVFPWVIADYTSPQIDLRDPKIYRDFNFPMGAQLEYRREALRVVVREGRYM